MMQVLQCGSPADGVEGRSYHQLWHSTQGHLPAAEAVAAGGQGQGDGGVGGAAGGDGGVPEGGRVGSAGGVKEKSHARHESVHARALHRITRGGDSAEKKGDDLTSAPGDTDAGREVWWTKETRRFEHSMTQG